MRGLSLAVSWRSALAWIPAAPLLVVGWAGMLVFCHLAMVFAWMVDFADDLRRVAREQGEPSMAGGTQRAEVAEFNRAFDSIGRLTEDAARRGELHLGTPPPTHSGPPLNDSGDVDALRYRIGELERRLDAIEKGDTDD
tara:strand:+ start:468 stop:884 length:417 start_codon:yes stop_codon:yes gene_type:complete